MGRFFPQVQEAVGGIGFNQLSANAAGVSGDRSFWREFSRRSARTSSAAWTSASAWVIPSPIRSAILSWRRILVQKFVVSLVVIPFSFIPSGDLPGAGKVDDPQGARK